MNRRQFLIGGSYAALIAIGGCVGIESVVNDVEGEQEYHISLVEIDDAPDEHGIEIDVDVVQEQLVHDDPPRVDVTFKNVGEQLIIGREGGINTVWFTHVEHHFFTLTRNEATSRRPIDDCWSTDEGPMRDDVVRHPEYEPGEREELHTYLLMNENIVEEACPEPGAYPFRTTVYLHDNDREGGVTDGEAVDCGFTLEVTSRSG